MTGCGVTGIGNAGCARQSRSSLRLFCPLLIHIILLYTQPILRAFDFTQSDLLLICRQTSLARLRNTRNVCQQLKGDFDIRAVPEIKSGGLSIIVGSRCGERGYTTLRRSSLAWYVVSVSRRIYPRHITTFLLVRRLLFQPSRSLAHNYPFPS